MVKIKYKEVDDGYQKLNSQIKIVKTAIANANSSLSTLGQTVGFEGITARNMATYIRRTDITNLRLISVELDKLLKEYKRAMSKFQGNVDSSKSAVLDSEILNDFKTNLEKEMTRRTSIQKVASEANNAAAREMGISDPSPSKMNNDLKKTIKVVTKTAKDLNTFNSSNFVDGTVKNITDVNSRAIKPGIKKAKSVGVNDFSNRALSKSTDNRVDALANITVGDSLFAKASGEDKVAKPYIESKPLDFLDGIDDYINRKAENTPHIDGYVDETIPWQKAASETKYTGYLGTAVSAGVSGYNDNLDGYDLNVAAEHFAVTAVPTQVIGSGLADIVIGFVGASGVVVPVAIGVVVTGAVGAVIDKLYNYSNGNDEFKNINNSISKIVDGFTVKKLKKSLKPTISDGKGPTVKRSRNDDR